MEPTRAVFCPNCHAQPGKTCTQPTNTGRTPVPWLHLSRLPKQEVPA